MCETKMMFDSPEFEKQFHCELPLGASRSQDGTLFRLWAPTVEEVVLRLYFRLVRQLEGGPSLRQDAHEAHPEIRIEQVFQRLYEEKGADCAPGLAIRTGLSFRRWSTDHLRLYPGAAELLGSLRAMGCGVWLLSNAQSIFTRLELGQLGIAQLFDGICDIEGAQAVGLSTIYIRSDLSPDEPIPQVGYVLDTMDLRQVREILASSPPYP